LRDFQSAIKTSPGFYEAYYLAGMAYLALQNSAEIEKYFRKSVDLSQKKYADADLALGSLVFRLLAIIHLRQKNYSALLTDLDAYLLLDPAGLRAKELHAQAEKQLLTSPGAAVSANK